jgi:hypothetical protein
MKHSIIAPSLACALAAPARAADTLHNVLLFVAGGLRPGLVNEQTAPAIAGLWKQGVRFANTHSMFPTFTTANASAMATGHKLGDTGDFSNTIDAGFRCSAPAKVSPHSWRATRFSAMSTSTTQAII